MHLEPKTDRKCGKSEKSLNSRNKKMVIKAERRRTQKQGGGLSVLSSSLTSLKVKQPASIDVTLKHLPLL